jgi:toxin ParE1/3/4
MILRLAPLARTDLVDIWRFGTATWSPGQADDYLDALRDFLLQLAENPLLGRPAGLQVDLYRFPHASHVVYDRIADDAVEIVRILHQRMDAERHL